MCCCEFVFHSFELKFTCDIWISLNQSISSNNVRSNRWFVIDELVMNCCWSIQYSYTFVRIRMQRILACRRDCLDSIRVTWDNNALLDLDHLWYVVDNIRLKMNFWNFYQHVRETSRTNTMRLNHSDNPKTINDLIKFEKQNKDFFNLLMSCRCNCSFIPIANLN